MLLLFFHEFVYTNARVSPKPCAQKKHEFMVPSNFVRLSRIRFFPFFLDCLRPKHGLSQSYCRSLHAYFRIVSIRSSSNSCTLSVAHGTPCFNQGLPGKSANSSLLTSTAVPTISPTTICCQLVRCIPPHEHATREACRAKAPRWRACICKSCSRCVRNRVCGCHLCEHYTHHPTTCLQRVLSNFPKPSGPATRILVDVDYVSPKTKPIFLYDSGF